MVLKKSLRIGIDRISLYNLDIKKISNAFVSEKMYEGSLIENKTVQDELFTIESTTTLYEDGKMKEFTSLTFNPNKILFKHNIFNSRESELNKALELLIRLLKEKDIVIDFSNAKINHIEINKNLPLNFSQYHEVLLLFFTQLNNSKATFRNTENPSLDKKLISESFFFKNSLRKIRVYDKRREIENSLLLDTDLLRFEYMFTRQNYAYWMKKIKEDNNLNTLLKKFEIIDYIFLKQIEDDFIKKSFNYIENNIKRTLEVQYTAFKRSNKFAKENNRATKRNVYKHLEKYWIFDYAFVIDLIKRCDKKHKGREINRVKKLLSKHKNLYKFNHLVEQFLSPQLPNSGDDKNLIRNNRELIKFELENRE